MVTKRVTGKMLAFNLWSKFELSALTLSISDIANTTLKCIKTHQEHLCAIGPYGPYLHLQFQTNGGHPNSLDPSARESTTRSDPSNFAAVTWNFAVLWDFCHSLQIYDDPISGDRDSTQTYCFTHLHTSTNSLTIKSNHWFSMVQ